MSGKEWRFGERRHRLIYVAYFLLETQHILTLLRVDWA